MRNEVIANLEAIRDSYEPGLPGWLMAVGQIAAYRRQYGW